MSEYKPVHASELRIGDLVDLEGNLYADPDGTSDLLRFELVEVVSVEREEPWCVAVGFEGFDVVGFPPDTLLKMRRF